MRLGAIVRCDDRGLGIQTRGFFNHLHPDRVLLIQCTPAISPLDQHPEWYDSCPEVIRVHWDGGPINEDVLRRFAHGLDLIYTAETFYDWRLVPIAAEHNCRTVCHYNAEFYRHHVDRDLPLPDVTWLHSSWMSDRFPHDRIMPTPVDRTHLRFRARTEVFTFLHIAGMAATKDRNGTQSILRSLSRVRYPCRLVIRTQRNIGRVGSWRSANVEVEVITGDIPDYQDLYSVGDVMLLPRRYGGGCLPMFEALSTGMPVLMTDTEPQSSILPEEFRIPTKYGGVVRTQGGQLRICEAPPGWIAQRMNRLLADPSSIEAMSKEADRIAQEYSWDVWLPRYRQALEEALG